MVTEPSHSVTRLLTAVSTGDGSAKDQLWTVVYDELHRMAHRQMTHEPGGNTLQTTALVNEAYLRLVGHDRVDWSNRRHFFAAASRAMRRIRIDDARKRGRVKRGGGQKPQVLLDDPGVFDQDPAQLFALDEALTQLEERDPRKAEVVMLRFFAGLSVDETAAALGVSARTVESEWKFARAWLHRELSAGDSSAT